MNHPRLFSLRSNPRKFSNRDLSAVTRGWLGLFQPLLVVLAIGSLPVANAQSNYATPYAFTTFAGSGVAGSGNTDGLGTAASFKDPSGVTVDTSGNIYVADLNNHKIRKITPAGLVSTFAGSGIPGSVDGSGTDAFFNGPADIALDASGNLFVADAGNHKIRKITPLGVVTTVAGSGTIGSTNGTGIAASFNYPCGVAVDASGNLFVADRDNNKIRKITPAGVVTTFAGSGSSGSLEGTGTAASFSSPEGVAIDTSGNIFVADTRNAKIRKVTPSGVVTTFTGSGSGGSTDGSGTAASFNSPQDLIVDGGGNVFVADSNNFDNHKIRKITSAAVVTTIAGINMAQDGPGTAANFGSPQGVAMDTSGNIFVADGSKIRKITPAGVVTTFAGSGSSGSTDGTGTAASFGGLGGVASDASGNLFIADTGNNKIRKITPAGVVTTFAGSGGQGRVNGTGTAASFSRPEGVAVDASGNVFVADASNHMIRKITPAGVVTTVAGSPTSESGSTDGTGTAARFNTPSDLAVAANGDLFVADRYNSTIRKITPAGVVSTFAGSSTSGGRDGIGTAARFDEPNGVAVDVNGNVFVVEGSYGGNHSIRKITPAGVVTTLAGSGDWGSADGNGAAASFWGPAGVAVDANGTVFVADTVNRKIRKGVPGPMMQTITFLPLSVMTSGDAPFALSASASSGLPVSYSILSGPATLSGDTVTLTGSGTVVIRASQSGNASFEAAAEIFQSFTVSSGATPSYHTYEFTTLLEPISSPSLALDTSSNLFVGSYNSSLIQKISSAGVVSTFATSTGINYPFGMAVDASGNVFVAASSRIYKINPAGVTSVFAGTGSQGSSNGIGTAASFWDARGIAVDASGNLFVVDRYNANIRKITPAGVVTTFAGSSQSQGGADGVGTAASFRWPEGLAMDASGNLIVADTGNHKIRKITPAGVVTTLAGSRTQGSADGTGAAARFSNPSGVTVDPSGNVFVSDTGNNKIRKITPWGEVTTAAGSGVSGAANGTSKVVSFYGPRGIAVDANGNLFVADSNNKIRKGVPITGAMLSQVITFSTLQDKTADDVFVALNANASSGLPVDFAIVSGPGTISGNAITLDGPGTVTVRASQTGNDFYIAAPPVDQSFVVTAETNLAPSVFNFSGMAGSGVQPYGSADGIGEAASFFQPEGIATDASGNVFVADSFNNKIRKITPAGVVTTLAGSGNQGSADGIGTAASFSYPYDVAVDASGNVFVADRGNNKIRKITPAGVVTTFAGSGFTGSADGSGTAASFSSPRGLAMDASGNLFVADLFNNKIRKITSAGVVTTLAGSGSAGSVNGTGTSASFSSPSDVAVDASGNVFVADSNNYKVRKISPAGLVSNLAGSGSQGRVDGSGSAASFDSPLSVAVDSSGNVFVAETYDNKIRKITPAGVVTTFAGSFSGSADGIGTAANFTHPTDVEVDASGNILVAEYHKIRKITPAAAVTTIAGTNMARDGSDAAAANFYQPSGVAVDTSGNVFVADTNNNKIRKITPAGVVTTFAGSGSYGSVDGIGTAASFASPNGVAVDASGNVFVAETFRIRKITPAGVVTTFAGSGSYGSSDGIGTAASFTVVKGLALDTSGNLFVADREHDKIRKITPAGVVTTFAGWDEGNVDGIGTAARFRNPSGVAVDGGGNVFVADTGNHKIRKITSAGLVTTFAGGSSIGSADGVGTAASFRSPEGIAVDSRGVVYVADTGNHKIRKISRDGVVTTVAGLAAYGSSDGIGTAAGFFFPSGVAVDASGNLYVGDSWNHKIRRGLAVLIQTITFNAIPDKTAGDPSFQLSATASSGLPVTFSILSGPATASGGVVTLTGPGTVVIRASQEGNASYAPAPATDQSFTVTGSTTAAAELGNWASAAGLSGPDSLPAATPFNDGVENLLKYAFNMNAAGPDVTVLTTGGSSGLPMVVVDQSGAEPVLKVAFLRRKGSGLIYTPQSSDNLGNFQSMTGTQTVISIDAQWERVSVEEPAPPATAPSAFARVQVSLP